MLWVELGDPYEYSSGPAKLMFNTTTRKCFLPHLRSWRVLGKSKKTPLTFLNYSLQRLNAMSRNYHRNSLREVANKGTSLKSII